MTSKPRKWGTEEGVSEFSLDGIKRRRRLVGKGRRQLGRKFTLLSAPLYGFHTYMIVLVCVHVHTHTHIHTHTHTHLSQRDISR